MNSGPAFEQSDLKQFLYDEEDENSINILENHSCNYFTPEEVHTSFKSGCFSLYSHNIRSLAGHFDDLRDNIYLMLPAQFTVIALQEIWSINRSFDLTGYSKLVYKTRDMNQTPNPNCGGGVGFFINSNFEFEVLEEESIFIEGVYESLWIKVKVNNNSYKIIGNVYRPNSAPKANLSLAISTHNSIISKIISNKSHSKCAIEIASDFNVDLLNFHNHAKTNEYLESLLSFGLLPTITRPTRVTHTTATVIDHIFVKNQSKSHLSGVITTSISDHFPIFYIDESKIPPPKPTPYSKPKITTETQHHLNNLLKNTNFDNVIRL
jgi:hypothetical protein